MGEPTRGDVAAAYVRAAWVAVALGAVWAAVAGTFFVVAVGALIGAINVAAAAIPGGGLKPSAARVGLAFAAAASPALLVLVVFRAPEGMAMVVGCVALLSVPASVAAEIQLARSRPPVEGTPFDGVGTVAILVSGVLAVLSSGATVALLREDLRFGCDYGLEGEGAGSWLCTDGVGYVGPLTGLLACGALALAVGLTIAVSRRPAVWHGVVLAVLSFVPVISAGLLTLAGVTVYAQTFPPGMDPVSDWMHLVVPSVVLALAGLALAAATARAVTGLGTLLFSIGIAAVVVAVPLQLGMLLAYLPAIGLALAARSRFVYLTAMGEFDARHARFTRWTGSRAVTPV
ncbi:hypothetical protein ACFXP7_02200 [Microbacterium sp. P06]|uniref:hypothetical protein n=1 Tax=Microbacterium sp. P06 TaxID=3366949 RepID=UPI003745F1B5